MALRLFLGDLIHPIYFSELIIIDDNHRLSATASPRKDLLCCSDSTSSRSKERRCRWGSLTRQSSDSSVMMAPKRNWSVKTTDSGTSAQSNQNGPERVREKVVSDSALSLPSRNLSPKSSLCTKGADSNSNQSWSPPDQQATVNAKAKQSDRLTSDILNDALQLIADGRTSSDPTIIGDTTHGRKKNLSLSPSPPEQLSPRFYPTKHCSGGSGTLHLPSLPSSLQVSRSFRGCYSSSSPLRLAKGTKHWDHSEVPNYNNANAAALTAKHSY